VNSAKDAGMKLTTGDVEALKSMFDTFLGDILGIVNETSAASSQSLKPFEEAVDLLLSIRAEAKAKKDWATSDLIRDRLAEMGFTIKDTKDGVEWTLQK
ncbi:MAG: cysteine--tRNA ligase, partial [Muribaculaceae bacterium]|nr:cysteine--tRNA ligase [Muribaculaceae bacterium]